MARRTGVKEEGARDAAGVAGEDGGGGLAVAGPPRIARVIPLDKVDRNPLNPTGRGELDPVLRDSMRELGQLQPVVVRPRGDRFELLAGERRCTAARDLGWREVSAICFEGELTDAGVVLLAENRCREDFDALEEAAVVVALRERKQSIESIAKGLGRSTHWVARRANLANLCALARAATGPKGVLASWPPSWLEEVALLPEAAQRAFLEEDLGIRDKKSAVGTGMFAAREFTSIDEVRDVIERRTRPLRLARWSLQDETLVPAVGSCAACPRQTCASPSLFGMKAEDGAKAEKGTCLDARCWAGKLEAWLVRERDRLRGEHGTGLLLVHSKGTEQRSASSADEAIDQVRANGVDKVDGARPLREWEYQGAGKKDGKPAMVVDGPKAGQLVYVKRRSTSSAPMAGASESTKARVAADAKRRERDARALKLLGERVKQAEWGDLDLAGLGGRAVSKVAAFLLVKTRIQADNVGYGWFLDPRDWRAAVKAGKGGEWPEPEALVDVAWASLRTSVAGNLEHVWGVAPKDVAWLGEMVGFDVVANSKLDLAPEPAPAKAKKSKKGGAK